jgi:hypothetical protein
MSRPLNLARQVCAPQWKRRVHTLAEALVLIDKELPKERRHAPHWRHARELLTRALRSRDPGVVEGATTQFERALQEEAPPMSGGDNDGRSPDAPAQLRSRPTRSSPRSS